MSPVLMRRARPWLGTLVEIGVGTMRPGGSTDPAAAIENAFGAISRVHAAMSAQLPDSDLGRLNRAHHMANLVCDPWTVRVLVLAERLRNRSGGLFDVALGSAARSHERYRIAGPTQVTKIGHSQFSLGGIAKGYAVDRAILALRQAGVGAGWVNAGGDLRVIGGAGLQVQVRGGSKAGELAAIAHLARGAFASSQYENGVTPFHGDNLIDPLSGSVARRSVNVSVAAPTCALADALTKVVALSNNPNHELVRACRAQAWLHHQPGAVAPTEHGIGLQAH